MQSMIKYGLKANNRKRVTAPFGVVSFFDKRGRFCVVVLLKHINITDYEKELFDACSLYQINGPFPGVITPENQTRFRTDDTSCIDDRNPCVVPNEGYNYSYVKTLLFGVFDWSEFCRILDCSSISNIGIYYRNSPRTWVCEHGVEVLTTHQKGIPYRQATGIIGLSGYPISDSYNTWHLADFDFDHPYIFDEGKYRSEFFSRRFLVQVRIHSCAMPGEKQNCRVGLVADIE